MSFSKATQILKLAFSLRASHYGKTLSEIADTFEISRRTAERMRDALIDLLGGDQVEGVPGEWQEETRWRVRSPLITPFISISESDLAVGAAATESLEAVGRHIEAAKLNDLLTKVHTLTNVASSAKINIDAEALSEVRAFALRPVPRDKLNPMHMNAIENAIWKQRQIEVRYRESVGSKAVRRRMMPVGVLMDRFHHLCAYAGMGSGRRLRLIRMDRIEDVLMAKERNPLAGRPTVEEVASLSFGPSVEETWNIVWVFAAHVADEASRVVFHPSQEKLFLKDGSLRVEFAAGGLQEMVWELVRWGDGVRVVEPEPLRVLLRKSLAASSRAAET